MYTSFPRIFTYIYPTTNIYKNEYQVINLKWHISFVSWLEVINHLTMYSIQPMSSPATFGGVTLVTHHPFQTVFYYILLSKRGGGGECSGLVGMILYKH